VCESDFPDYATVPSEGYPRKPRLCRLRLSVWLITGGHDTPFPSSNRVRRFRSLSMSLDVYVKEITDFVAQHRVWAAPIAGALAFGESLAFISLVIPALAALVAIGALIGPSGINFWPIWIAGSLGAALGDWLSYWIGGKIGPRVAHIWPLSRNPDLIPRGERFMQRWGVLSIFIGRFFGPLRASVPLVAGIFEMPYWSFQIANFVSAFVWAAVLLTIGDSLTRLLQLLWA
jgi:membrane protein DedA with SNARE-associated domain